MFVVLLGPYIGSRARLSTLWSLIRRPENFAEKAAEEFAIPKNFIEVKESVNKLSIDDLRTFCFTFALAQDGSKASLKEPLIEYYRRQFTSVNGTPKPTPRKKSAVKSPPSNAKEVLASETIDGIDVMDQKSDELLKEWDEFHSQILRISEMAEDFIAKNGVNALSSDIT